MIILTPEELAQLKPWMPHRLDQQQKQQITILEEQYRTLVLRVLRDERISVRQKEQNLLAYQCAFFAAKGEIELQGETRVPEGYSVEVPAVAERQGDPV